MINKIGANVSFKGVYLRNNVDTTGYFKDKTLFDLDALSESKHADVLVERRTNHLNHWYSYAGIKDKKNGQLLDEVAWCRPDEAGDKITKSKSIEIFFDYIRNSLNNNI